MIATGAARGTLPHGVLTGRGTTLPVIYEVGQAEGRPFFALELTAYRGGSDTIAPRGHGSRAHGVLRPRQVAGADLVTLRASDLGYRSRITDADGIVVYPPRLTNGFQISRDMALSPNGDGAGSSYGSSILGNLDGAFDAFLTSYNVDGRPMRILAGVQSYEYRRGIFLDPPRAELATIFAGFSKPWVIGQDDIQVPLRDASYLIEAAIQGEAFAGTGTGTLEGSADMKGRKKPRARGGSVAAPIRNVSGVWVDQVDGILQFSDTYGLVVTLSENGDSAQIQFQSVYQDTDPHTVTVLPGHYSVCSNAAGLFVKLGSVTSGTITADIVGAFPDGVIRSTAAAVALEILRQDLQVPEEWIAASTFAGLDASRPWIAGEHWDGTADVQGVDAVGLFLRSLGARMIPGRDGRLRAVPLRPNAAGDVPIARYGPAEIVSVTPVPLPDSVWPLRYRFPVGYLRNHTVFGESDVDPDVTGANLDWIKQEWLTAAAFSAAGLRAYGRPQEADLVQTALLRQEDAQALAAELVQLWGQDEGEMPPICYDVELPLRYVMRHEIGERLILTYPMANLRGGVMAGVVGDTMSATSATATLRVLVS